jgi:hypothetical protein
MTKKNVSDGSGPIEFQTSSSLLVLIDPLVLDGLSTELHELSPSEVAANPNLIRALRGPMKVGLHRIEGLVPGTYRIANDDLESADSNETDLGVFDIDTGTLILVDLDYLPRLAKTLTWERYDRAFRGCDDSTWLKFAEEIGGPFFGILWGDIGTPFQGDGTYRVKSGAPRLVT